MKVRKFTRKWKIGAVATMLASLSLGVAVGCGETEAPEITKGLGMFYFDAGIEEYQLSLGDGNKVTFVANGEIKTGTYVNEGATVTFKFDGEETETTATIEGDVLTWTYNANEQMRFFKKVYYTVSYDEQNGSAVDDTTVVNGKTVAKPADPVREGYEFLGWYMDADFKTPFMFDTQIVTSNVTLYASWALVTPGAVAYTVDFDLGYEGGETPAPIDTISGKLYGAPTVERQGYVFRGWWMSDYEDGNKLTRPYTPDMVFKANTTLFAVWESDNLGQKLSAPNVQVTDNGITWDGVSGARNYRVKVTGPNGFLTINEETPATNIAIDFANAPAGDFNIEVTAVAYDESNNSDKVTRGYINKAVGRVSQFTVLDGKVLLFNRVENAQVYYVTVECGNSSHNHVLYNNGDSTYYSFLNCDMQEGGIRFTVTASADGYADVVSETFVYNRSLDKVEGLTVDEETQMLTWYPVKDATNYIVSISCDNAAHDHSYVNVGTKTSFSLKECYDMDGDIKINVYAQTKGYNSPAPTEYSYTKTKIATPSNVTVSNDGSRYILSWNAVTVADGTPTYSIKIGNEIITTTETSYDITDAITWIPDVKYSVSVKATVGTNESVWSDPVDAYYYAMMGKVSYKNGVASWQSVLGATAYEVKVNTDGAVMTVRDSSTPITFPKEGTNTIYVRFIDETKNYYPNEWISCEVNNVLPVIFDSRGGTEAATQYKASGDPIALPQPTRAGYTFAGWYNTPNGPESNGAKYDTTVFEENNELVLYAYWTPAKYALTYNVGADGALPDGVTAGEAVYTQNYKLAVPTVDDATKVFLGWFAGSTPGSVQLTDDRGYSLGAWDTKAGATVYAQYVTNVLTFTYLENSDSYSVTKGANATKLTSITIPQTYNNKPVTVVDGNAFMQCSKLVTLNIPDTIEIISEETAFSGCKRLEEINIIPTGNKLAVYSSVDGVLLHKNEITSSMELCYFPQAKSGSYAIPEGVTEIPLKVFENAKITEITIPTTVSIIRGNAFVNCVQLEKVIFEEGGNVGLSIENGAFQDCKALSNITFPARLTELALDEETHTMSIFMGCTALTHVNVERGNQVYASIDGVITNKAGDTIIFCPTARKGSYTVPSSIETIGAYAFANCNLLTEIVVPATVASIGAHAFENATRVARIVFDDSTAVVGMETEIGDYAFAGLKALKQIVFEENSVVTSIGNYAFSNASGLRELTIPASMKTIGDYAFEEAKVLTSVKFQDGNKGSVSFGNYVFSECTALTKVELPKSVTHLALGVFDGCVNIAEVDIAEENEYYMDIDGVVFTKNCDEILFFPRGKQVTGGEYVLPDTVETISEAAFRGVRYVTTIEIGKNVTHIGKYAFEDSVSLANISFEADGTAPLVIDDMAFAGCANIKSVDLDNRISKIGAKAFYGVAMTSVSFPANLTEIGDYAFARTAIKNVVIPANVTTFGSHVFEDCSKLTDASFEKGYVGKEIPAGTFKNTAITKMEIPASIEAIYYTAFNGCSALKELTFAAGGTASLVIGYTADENASLEDTTGVFMNCTSLAKVNFPDRVSYIGSYAFSGCSAITEATFGTDSTLERIGTYAFSACTSLSTITIPASVRNTVLEDEAVGQQFAIGRSAFAGAGLSSVTFAEKAGDDTREVSIAEGAFAACGKFLGYDGKGNPMVESMTVINLPSCLAPITYTENVAGTINVYEVEGVSSQTFNGGSGETLLTQINVAAGGKYYGSKDGILYKLAERNGKYVMDELMLVPQNYSGAITIPYTVSHIGSRKSPNPSGGIGQKQGVAITGITFEKTPAGETPVELSIVARAFYGMSAIKSVEFPDRLVEIGNYAFYGTGLSSVTLPASLKTLGENAFQSCTSLTTVEFASGIQITKIPRNAFNGCSKLASIEIPANVTTIEYGAFDNCSKLTSLEFADNSALTKIDSFAFRKTAITKLELPENLTSFDAQAFGGITNTSTLKEIILPKTFSAFFSYSNSGNPEFFFNPLTSLTKVTIHEENPYFMTEDGVVYTKGADGKRGTELVYYPRQKSPTDGVFTTPAGVQTIGAFALYKNYNIDKLVVSADCTSIGYQAFSSSTVQMIEFAERDSQLKLGEQAFYGCSYLTGTPTQMEDGTTKRIFTIPETVVFVGNDVFNGCFRATDSDKNFVLDNAANGVYVVFEGENESTALNGTFSFTFNKNKSTGKNSYTYVSAIVGVYNIPANLSSMTKTFNGCASLKEVTFYNDPNGFIDTMAGTFTNCVNLETIDLPEIGALTNATPMVSAWKTNGGYNGAFQNCTNLKTVTMKSCLTLGVSTFDGCPNLTSVTLPDTIVRIGTGSFYGCNKLTNIDLPANLEAIEDFAFQNCSSLTSIVIPNFVTTIGVSAFEGCNNVRTVEFGDNVISVADRAFYNMNAVQTVKFQNMLETIGNYSFYNWSSLTALDIPASVTDIGDYAFANCINVQSVTGCQGVITFGDYAFANMRKVKSFVIPDNMNSLGIGVFSGWESLTDLQAGGNFDYQMKDGVLYDSAYTKIVFVSGSVSGEVTVPSTIVSLSEALFANTKITKITLPDTITEIPASAFENCTDLVEVVMPAALEKIGNNAFKGCTSLKEITIPKTVYSTFEMSPWASDDGGEVGFTFQGASDGIGAYAFGGCTSLENVIFEEGGTKRLSFGPFAFYGCTSLKGVEDKEMGGYVLTIPSRVRGSYMSQRLQGQWVTGGSNNGYRSAAPDTRFTQGIGMYAFARSGVENVVFEDETGAPMPEKLLLDIGAFYECTKLQSVTFGNTLGNMANEIAGRKGNNVYEQAAIAENAFYGCRSLTTVTVSSEVKNAKAAKSAFASTQISSVKGLAIVDGACCVSEGGREMYEDSGSNRFYIDGCATGHGSTEKCGYDPHNGICDIYNTSIR